MAILGACSTGSKAPSALVAQSERLNDELTALADNSPAFIDQMTAGYDAGTLSINIAFSDPAIHAASISEPLVQYVLAQYMKSHTGADLDETLNTLTAEKGQMEITIEDMHAGQVKYTIPAARLVKLLKLKPMEIGYNDVKANVSNLLEARCNEYKEQYNALECEFELKGGFAQYTLTFNSATAYANLNQASLTGRYLKVLQPRYESYGACRDIVENLLRSLSIDGYRFVYKDTKGNKTLSAGIPWRTIDK